MDWYAGIDFLTERVRVGDASSDVLFSSADSPQGCVLSPLLFVLYTNERHSQQSDASHCGVC